VVITVRKFLLRVYTLCRVVTRGLGSDNSCSESKTDCGVYVLIVCFPLLIVLLFLLVEYIYVFIQGFDTCAGMHVNVLPQGSAGPRLDCLSLQ
jgi:hypothetical protein